MHNTEEKFSPVDRLILFYLNFMLYMTIGILILIILHPILEKYVIFLIFGEKGNQSNITYVPARHFYLGPNVKLIVTE